MSDAVSRFGVTELDALPEDLRERVGAAAEKSGFVPNVFRALGHRPAELRAFLDQHDALMDRSDGLSKAERELIVVATSGANHCSYCVVAHGAILRVRAKDSEIADRVATNPWGAELEDRERAIVDLALALTREPELFGEPDLAAARAAGLSQDEIWDVGAITALFAMSNRLAHLCALAPNPEFYKHGPRAPLELQAPELPRSAAGPNPSVRFLRDELEPGRAVDRVRGLERGHRPQLDGPVAVRPRELDALR